MILNSVIGYGHNKLQVNYFYPYFHTMKIFYIHTNHLVEVHGDGLNMNYLDRN